MALGQSDLDTTVAVSGVLLHDAPNHAPKLFIANAQPLFGTLTLVARLLADARKPTHGVDAYPPEGHSRARVLYKRPSGGA